MWRIDLNEGIRHADAATVGNVKVGLGAGTEGKYNDK